MIHMWDGTESASQKWRGCADHHGDLFVDGDGCITFGDRLSASIIFEAKAPLFGGGGGVIFKPEYNRILCAFGGDGGTKHGEDDGCGREWCDPRVGEWDGWCDGAPHRPEDLDNMLRWWGQYGTSYNEVLVDVAYMNAHLPQSVEAIMWDWDTWNTFIEFYGVDPQDYPLVGFSADFGAAPFYQIN